MSATWTSNLPEWKRRHNAACAAALIAAAHVLINAVKKNHRGGFTSGKFVTGQMLNAVTRSEPITEDGVWVIRVGTNVMHDLFWTIGHINLFTRKYEREDHWTPALTDSATEIRATVARVYAARMAAA